MKYLNNCFSTAVCFCQQIQELYQHSPVPKVHPHQALKMFVPIFASLCKNSPAIAGTDVDPYLTKLYIISSSSVSKLVCHFTLCHGNWTQQTFAVCKIPFFSLLQ